MRKFFSLLLSMVLVFSGCVAAMTIAYVVINSSPDWNETEPEELTEIGSPYKFYYEKLESIQKHAYNEILKNIYSMPEKIRIPNLDRTEMEEVFYALLADNPDLFFVGRAADLETRMLKTYCRINYIFTREEYEESRRKLENACEKIISSLTDTSDLWKTELEIHDYIVDNCSYKFDEKETVYSTAYGAIVNGLAACEGYSKAAKMLFDELEIESAVVSGSSADFEGVKGNHMWNAVKINGDFYYLDCTWDDPVSSTGESVKTYYYFNVSNEMLKSTHSDFSYDFECNSEKENYYVKTGKYFKTYDKKSENALSDLIARELENGETEIQIRFASSEVYELAVDDLINHEEIRRVLNSASKKTSVDFSTNSLIYYQDKSRLTLTFVPELK